MKKSFLKALSVVLSLLLTVSVFSSCNSEKEVKPVIEEKYSKPLYYVEDGTFGYNIYEKSWKSKYVLSDISASY